MSSKLPRFPNINYNYWCQKNEYFSDTPLIDTIKTGLNHARKGGLIDVALKNTNIQTNKNLVDLIDSKIKKYPSIENFNDDELMLIFDLIQGWGGKMGRNIYVQPKNNPTRRSHLQLPTIYRKAMGHCILGDYRSALKEITSIPNLGESFATKHIFFWSEFGPSRKALPIYDTRIKTLLFLKTTAAQNYDVYVKALNEKAKELSMAPALVERALFSFSQNYFPNGKLLINDLLSDRTDLEEAMKLQALSKNL
jgi:hypothetical protein